MSRGRSHGRKARLGQNFLVNEGACERIVDAAGDLSGHPVLEVGPGRGALTRRLASRAAFVLALELDAALAEALAPELPEDRCEILLQDAVKADWAALAGRLLARGAPPIPLVANLPYESGTAILQGWLAASAAEPMLDRAIVMLQREVAERVTAPPSTKAYGYLAVLAQSTHRVRTVMDVSPGSFRPAPSVQSRVLRLDRLEAPLFAPDERTRVAGFLHAAFSSRRKQLAGLLAGRGGRTREDWQALLAGRGIPPTVRAEELEPAALVALSRD